MPGQEEGKERRRLLVGYLVEGKGEREREGEEVDARSRPSQLLRQVQRCDHVFEAD